MAESSKQIRPELRAGVPQVPKPPAEAAEDIAKMHVPDFPKGGVLSTKQKELISLGVAIGIACDYCIAIHVGKCFEAGATKEEIAEACGIAFSMGGKPALACATVALRAIEELATCGS